MRLSLAWLNELLGHQYDTEPLARLLTNAGLVVDEIHPGPDGDVLVAEVTTNRPDWLGHHGVAREISALTGDPFTPPEISLPTGGPPVADFASVTVEPDAAKYCPRYTARVIRGVKVGPSPDWLKRRLEAIGQRSINTVVDVTNLVCFEMNQPLHAFDLDRLAGHGIVVRMGRKGEPFAAITGETGTLDGSQLVIADAEKAVALAGVKGAVNSEVGTETRNILLESAYFEPAQVRRSGRSMKMSSESSHRFERGVDPGMVERCGARATQLILELAGGELASGVIDTNPLLAEPWEVSVRFARCEALLGFRFPEEEIVHILTGLGLAVVRRDGDGLAVRVPTSRQDLTREIDLIEEIARVGGYDRIPERVGLPLLLAAADPMVEAKRAAREVLVGLGYHECFCDAFVPEGWAEPFIGAEPERVYPIQNPINAGRPVMRRSLLPSLMEVRRTNRNEPSARLFEINRVYDKTPEGPEERIELAILDDRGPEYVRGAMEAVASFMKLADPVALRVPSDDAARPGYAAGTRAQLWLGESMLAEFGLASAAEAKRHDLNAAPGLLSAELGVAALAPKLSRWYKAPPRFPAVRRDLAVVVPEATRWGLVAERVAGAAPADRLESVRLESVYRGKGLEPGEKCLAFAMTFRSAEGSLTDEEANALRDAVMHKVLAAVPGSRLR